MGEIAYAMVSQTEALKYESRGHTFPKGKVVKVINPADIEAFKTDGVLKVIEVPVVRKKVAPAPPIAEASAKAGKAKSKKKK